MELLKKLLSLQSLSGNEGNMRDFLISYFQENENNFLHRPTLYYGDDFQDCLAVVFGKPRTAVFAHMDTVGFMVRYGFELTEVGQPHIEAGYKLTGQTPQGQVECATILEKKDEDEFALYYDHPEVLPRGTELSFAPDFHIDEEFIQSPYLDNRIGIWNALQLAHTLKNGILVFTCYEEHSGGSTGYMGKFVYEQFGVRQALISDVTWITHGIKHGKGVVISLRDSGIPRRSYVNKIISIAEESGIPFQLEVESAGGSDGNELQKMPFPIDWCFVGVAESNVHTPNEKIDRKDLEGMTALYQVLMDKL